MQEMEAVFGRVTPGLLMAIVVGLVEVVKKVVQKEPLSWKFWLALVLGTLLGGGYVLVSVEGLTPKAWFAATCYGLLTGLTPTGLYSAVRRIFTEPEDETEPAEYEDEFPF